jgi:sugar/nucleoside kinase (ribokinase family)
MNMADFISIGSIIIDDIVFPDGRTRMGVLGGGAAHAASGMRVWSDSVGLIGAIGSGFPAELYARLNAAFDLRGVLRRAVPTPRAWQLFEYNGHRNEVFRTDPNEFRQHFTLRPLEVEDVIGTLRGAYLLSGKPDSLREWVAFLRTRHVPVILWEPWDVFMQPENLVVFGELASLVDIVSPNLIESRRMTGESKPEDVAHTLMTQGARVVALRMGEAGSLVACGAELVSVPGLSFGPIVDATGAGNAYCGGLLVGWVESNGDLHRAGLCGAVAASFALSQFGVFIPGESTRAEVHRRLATVQTEAG